MKNSKRKLKGKILNKNTPTKDATGIYIQPFREMPSLNSTGQESEDRINAHNLFLLYTADIIKEDTIFSR